MTTTHRFNHKFLSASLERDGNVLPATVRITIGGWDIAAVDSYDLADSDLDTSDPDAMRAALKASVVAEIDDAVDAWIAARSALHNETYLANKAQAAARRAEQAAAAAADDRIALEDAATAYAAAAAAYSEAAAAAIAYRAALTR